MPSRKKINDRIRERLLREFNGVPVEMPTFKAIADSNPSLSNKNGDVLVAGNNGFDKFATVDWDQALSNIGREASHAVDMDFIERVQQTIFRDTSMPAQGTATSPDSVHTVSIGDINDILMHPAPVTSHWVIDTIRYDEETVNLGRTGLSIDDLIEMRPLSPEEELRNEVEQLRLKLKAIEEGRQEFNQPKPEAQERKVDFEL
jgi:hypothetical protein